MNKYEWTPNGLKMLQDIENSILKYGGRGRLLFSLVSELHKGYACKKNDCDFCERFRLKVELPAEKTNSHYLNRPVSIFRAMKVNPKKDFERVDF